MLNKTIFGLCTATIFTVSFASEYQINWDRLSQEDKMRYAPININDDNIPCAGNEKYTKKKTYGMDELLKIRNTIATQAAASQRK